MSLGDLQLRDGGARADRSQLSAGAFEQSGAALGVVTQRARGRRRYVPVGAGAQYLFLPANFTKGDDLAVLAGNVDQYSFELPSSAQLLGEYSSVRPERKSYFASAAGGLSFRRTCRRTSTSVWRAAFAAAS